MLLRILQWLPFRSRFECTLKAAMKKLNCVPWYLPQKNGTKPCRCQSVQIKPINWYALALLRLPNSRMRWPWSMGPLANACQIVRIQITSTPWHPVSLGGYFIMKLISFRVRSTIRLSSGRVTPETLTWTLCVPWKMDQFLTCGWTKYKQAFSFFGSNTNTCTGERCLSEKYWSLAAWLHQGIV